MMFYYQLSVTAVLFVLFLIAVWNIYLFRKKKIHIRSDSELPFVSILVPARNEEINIGECAESLLKQN